MTLNQLRYFCTAARFHSISKAANALFVTQPTISIAVRDLEKEFQVTLFTHANNHITLTEEGEIFYNKVSQILNYCDSLQAEYDSNKAALSRVRIGIPPMLSTIYFPELLDAFHEKHPDIWLELQEFGSVRACELVKDDVLDIALVNMEIPDIDKFHSFQIGSEPSFFSVCENHPMAGEEELTLEQLHDKPLILFNQDSVHNQILQSRFAMLQVKPRIIMRSSQITTIMKFLRQGKCGCFFYKSMLSQLSGVVGIPLTPVIETRVGLVWRRGRYINSGMQAFLDFCRNFEV